MNARVRLGVNIDHVATVRNARSGDHPDPIRAAEAAMAAGADGITAHLREDRRHIRDADVERLAEQVRGAGRKFNLEMAATAEMLRIAQRVRPGQVCLVPERRQELTTEGGLNAVRLYDTLGPIVDGLRARDIFVSLFVEPSQEQVNAAELLGAHAVELHTGAWCDAVRGTDRRANKLLDRLRETAVFAGARGLEVHAGHGLDYDTAAVAAALPEVVELNIGHFLVGEAVFVGLESAIARMREAMDGVIPAARRDAVNEAGA